MRLIVNGKPHTYHGSPLKRLSDVLRDDLGFAFRRKLTASSLAA